MVQFVRNFVAVCIGLTLFVALITAGFFVGLAVLAAGIVLWIYIRLRLKGVIGGAAERTNAGAESPSLHTIEVDYEIVEEEAEERKDDNRI